MGKKVTVTDEQPRVYFDCSKCPAFCCSIYDRVQVTKRDLNRLAKYFKVSAEVAQKRYTKIDRESGERVLRRVKDAIFERTCMFLNQETRGCTIYHARPAVCREYPDRTRCVYYDILKFEQKQQDDETVLPLIQITFREVKKEVVHNGHGSEKIWEWKNGDE
jgi:Fe-S-cluster containining protein